MTPGSPSLDEIETLLDRHGSDLSRWPAADAARVQALLPASAEARRSFEEAIALDRLLDASLPAPAGIGMNRKARILDAIRSADVLARLVDWFRRGPWLWRPVAMALIPLVLGFGAGLGLPGDDTSDDELITELHLLAFDAVEDYRDAQ